MAQLMTDKKISCPSCGNSHFEISYRKEIFDYGSGNDAVELSAEVPVQVCKGCQFSFTQSEAEDIRHEVVCRYLGRLTPSQILEIRNSRKLTQAQFAELTGIGTASLSRWETGELIQGAAQDNYLYLLNQQMNLDFLESRRCEKLADAERDNSNDPVEASFRHVSPDDPELLRKAQVFSLCRH